MWTCLRTRHRKGNKAAARANPRLSFPWKPSSNGNSLVFLVRPMPYEISTTAARV